MNERIKNALQAGIIDIESYNRIILYRERLISNNVPVIYNLRHVRKIFGIKKREQDVFFGKNRGSL